MSHMRRLFAAALALLLPLTPTVASAQQGATITGRRGLVGIAVEPLSHVVVVELLRPEHAREGLALHQPLVVAQSGRL